MQKVNELKLLKIQAENPNFKQEFEFKSYDDAISYRKLFYFKVDPYSYAACIFITSLKLILFIGK